MKLTEQNRNALHLASRLDARRAGNDKISYLEALNTANYEFNAADNWEFFDNFIMVDKAWKILYDFYAKQERWS